MNDQYNFERRFSLKQTDQESLDTSLLSIPFQRQQDRCSLLANRAAVIQTICTKCAYTDTIYTTRGLFGTTRKTSENTHIAFHWPGVSMNHERTHFEPTNGLESFECQIDHISNLRLEAFRSTKIQHTRED